MSGLTNEERLTVLEEHKALHETAIQTLRGQVAEAEKRYEKLEARSLAAEKDRFDMRLATDVRLRVLENPISKQAETIEDAVRNYSQKDAAAAKEIPTDRKLEPVVAKVKRFRTGIVVKAERVLLDDGREAWKVVYLRLL